MIGVEARELRKGDEILGIGTVLRPPGKPDEWGEITLVVKESDGQRFLVKLDGDAYFRIERPDEEGVE